MFHSLTLLSTKSGNRVKITGNAVLWIVRLMGCGKSSCLRDSESRRPLHTSCRLWFLLDCLFSTFFRKQRFYWNLITLLLNVLFWVINWRPINSYYFYCLRHGNTLIVTDCNSTLTVLLIRSVFLCGQERWRFSWNLFWLNAKYLTKVTMFCYFSPLQKPLLSQKDYFFSLLEVESDSAFWIALWSA